MDENEKSGFFKSNLDGISKLFVYHIAMCVFGIVVVLAVQMITEHITGDRDMPLGIPAYIAAGFAVIVYCGLIYVAMWEKGASDKIKIDGGRQKKNIAKGLLIWLIASSVDIAILLLIAIFSFIPFLDGAHGILSIVAMFYNGMYIPELALLAGHGLSPLFLVTLIPAGLVAFLSYLSGVSGQKCIFPEPKHERNRKLK
ncbi:MAG: hypothetical protein IKC16_05685 [Clostridia bacterium]|nr:hypothetical protein [Clostridia bacterium]